MIMTSMGTAETLPHTSMVKAVKRLILTVSSGCCSSLHTVSSLNCFTPLRTPDITASEKGNILDAERNPMKVPIKNLSLLIAELIVPATFFEHWVTEERGEEIRETIKRGARRKEVALLGVFLTQSAPFRQKVERCNKC